jgi:sulfite reductase alpha subunit-like flavoprotein
MLDAFQKMLAWLAAMLTGATFRRGSARGHSQKLALSSPVTILFCTATGTKTAPATASAAKNEKWNLPSGRLHLTSEAEWRKQFSEGPAP